MDGELSISFSRDFFERHLHGKILFTKEGRTNLSISFSRDFFEREVAQHQGELPHVPHLSISFSRDFFERKIL